MHQNSSPFWIDSHCHLHLLDLTKTQGASSLKEIIQKAADAGVIHLLSVATHLDQDPLLKSFCAQDARISCSVGLHPDEVNPREADRPVYCMEDIYAELLEKGADPFVVAIGETGLDYYRPSQEDTETQRQQKKKRQQDSFIQHMLAAKELNKPLIIHSRSAQKDTIALLKEYGCSQADSARRGVFHCFTEDYAMAKAALDLNYYISLSGIVTFKNALDLQEVARKLPLNRLLIETDAPFLAPVPHRGQENQPAYVADVGRFLAQLKNCSVAECAEQTTANSQFLFQCPIRTGQIETAQTPQG